MTHRILKNAALLASLIFVGRVAAGHDGPHKIMGTVASVGAYRIEVTTADHKSASVVTDEKTKVIHDKMVMKVTDLKAGDRAVITAFEKKDPAGKVTLAASEIRLGVSGPKPKKQSAPSSRH
jgi:hypothetical protein